MENNETIYNVSNEYPYGIFPLNYTKEGQEKIKHEIQEQAKKDIIDVSEPAPRPALDISKLLPLIKLMGNKKSLSQGDMLQLLVPMLTGANVDISEILKTIEPSNEPEEAEDIIPNQIKISSYKKIEWLLILFFV